MNQTGIHNERAKFAFEKIQALSGENKDKYLRSCRKAPSQIKVNGFGMTMAFLYAKEESMPLFCDILEWLKKQDTGLFHNENQKDEDKDEQEQALGAIAGCDRDKYRQMSRETMSLLVWLKRFAEGMLK